ncbi:right-handed parallel beta-helix repeat-containing protein [Sphingosinicella sp.]|uniref:right-handed parallel beta-helix repeat-containing protein n=1 Tax=Sphingosinicella sp. TaxID=1917971 RepID=UPI0026270F9B|nr:right-handed parallel beta-helix repeat-containing protein [Sphingosinicella sp.]
MTLRFALAAALATGSAGASAATLAVGGNGAYATLTEAARDTKAGDTIVLAPGLYEGARFHADGLTIRAAADALPGSVVVGGEAVGGKGLFVISGDDATITGLTFEGARAADGNGAGIRAEGRNLTVTDTRFIGNEMGILANSVDGSVLTVRRSRFTETASRAPDRVGHAVYANGIARLVVTGSTFERGARGHYIKSRALDTRITGNRIDDTNGSASYLIDLPEGGAATIADNLLVKGPRPDNCCTAIAYGFEMQKGGSYANPPGPVRVYGNRFVNRAPGTVTFFANRSAPANTGTLSDNEMIAERGRVVAATGNATVNGKAAPASHFSDAAAFAEMALKPPMSGIFALLGFGLAGIIVGRRKPATQR